MSNINYPSWESGIPERLPYINPYSSDNMYIELATIIQIWDWESITRHSVPDQLRLKYAWSYTEILKWLREEYKFQVIIETAGNKEDFPKYTFRVYTDLSNEWDIILKWTNESYEDFIKKYCYDTYEQALDEAILYCLNLIEDETK